MKEINSINIGKRKIGKNFKPYIIAEVAQAHDGSLGMAHSYIDLAKNCGADAVKFQTHIADEESTKDDRFRVGNFVQDNTRYDYWKRMEFSEEQWKGLRTHAESLKIDFLSTPFSIKAFNILQKLDMPAWKVGSGETQNIPLITKMLESSSPVIISTGLSSWQEIDSLVNMAKDYRSNFALLQCTTAYPTEPRDIGLNILSELSKRYGCVYGLSDHSGKIFSPVSALALGSSIIEAHITFSKLSFGPDTKASLDPQQFKMLVEARDFIYQIQKSPVKKEYLSDKNKDLKVLFGRSLVASKDIAKGEKLTMSHFSLKKPGGGLSYSDIESIKGKSSNRAYKRNEKIDKSLVK
jgi:N-acetylneuraminate synthase